MSLLWMRLWDEFVVDEFIVDKLAVEKQLKSMCIASSKFQTSIHKELRSRMFSRLLLGTLFIRTKEHPLATLVDNFSLLNFDFMMLCTFTKDKLLKTLSFLKGISWHSRVFDL